MIILRSITDGFDILLGSQYTQFSLAIAYWVTLDSQDWEPVYFAPESEYWVAHDKWTFGLIKMLFGLHIGLGCLVKFHEIAKSDNTILTGIGLGFILIEAADVFKRHIFFNPRAYDDMTPAQERAVQMSTIEVLSYATIMLSCAFYTFVRVLFGPKMG